MNLKRYIGLAVVLLLCSCSESQLQKDFDKGGFTEFGYKGFKVVEIPVLRDFYQYSKEWNDIEDSLRVVKEKREDIIMRQDYMWSFELRATTPEEKRKARENREEVEREKKLNNDTYNSLIYHRNSVIETGEKEGKVYVVRVTPKNEFNSYDYPEYFVLSYTPEGTLYRYEGEKEFEIIDTAYSK